MLLAESSGSEVVDEEPGVEAGVAERAVSLDVAPFTDARKAVAVIARRDHGGASVG